MLRHLLSFLHYYGASRRVSIPSPLAQIDALTALRALGGAEGLSVQIGNEGQVVINCTGHYERRGRPLIPILRGALLASADGVTFAGTIALEPGARAKVLMFSAVLAIAWLVIARDPTIVHVVAGLIVTGVFWGFLEVGHYIGRQDTRQIMERVSEALKAGKRPAGSADHVRP